MRMLRIAQEAPGQDEATALLRRSDAFMLGLYPPEHCHLIDVAALSAPAARFFLVRIDGRAVGCGALVLAADGTAEIKRMFVDAAARGHGVGRGLLQILEDTARQNGVRLLLLETGVRNAEALHLYRGCGFTERGPFADYPDNGVSLFFEKRLGPTDQ
jgi:putative acetyltransferase